MRIIRNSLVLFFFVFGGSVNADTVYIFTEDGPKALKDGRGNDICGAYTWDVRFQIHPPASDAGYIIQEVHYQPQVNDCETPSNKIDHKQYTIYEAWPVSAGGTGTDRPFGQTVDDSFTVNYNPAPHNKRTRGTVKITGKIKFFPGKSFPADFPQPAPAAGGPDNGGWMQNNPHTTGTGALLAGTTRPDRDATPKWWRQPNDGTKDHSIEYTWDCCNPARPFHPNFDRLKRKPSAFTEKQDKKKIASLPDDGESRQYYAYAIGLAIAIALALFFLFGRRSQARAD